MTTTSLLPHKPTTRNNVPFRSSHYGSMGRPTSGRRKSAVELLQETKAFYVKSESVLDTKQELRNTDHLHVKSPTVDVVANHYRSLPGNPAGTIIPFFPIGTCPPYPHHHYERYEHIQFKFENVLHPQQQQQFGINDRKRIYDVPKEMTPRNFALAPTSHKNRSGKSNARCATLPSGHSSGKRHKDLRGLSSSGKSKLGMTISYTTDQDIPGLLRLGPQKNLTTATLPASSKISHVPENIPPPLPPRSPKTTKPPRPHDFPQRLPVQGMVPTASAHPLTAPRRLLPQENDHSHSNDGNIQSKLRRLLHDGRSVPPVVSSDEVNLVPIITLPSPILPPTPPPDVTLESPMSDSGPIISPPPAFSTPVTPMLDRQNSSASEKSSQRHEPLSAAMSMVSISSVSSPNSRKSMPSLSDMSVNNHCSPPAYSSSSAMSPDDAHGDDGDDDSSENISKVKINIPNTNVMKKTPIPKSVTENTLCKTVNVNSPDKHVPPQASEASPVRRPILRSKSDLSHRYMKSSNSSTLLGGGFTLVHVDLGLPPPPPPHQNNLFSYQSNAERMEEDSYDKKRCSISSLELERFFDKLGLESNTPPPATSAGVNGGNNSNGSSPVFFSSVSSVDSGPRRCGSVDSGDSPVGIKIGSRTVGGGGYNAPAATTSGSSILVKHGEPSIVERNARVIKWLFNCRKAVNKR